MGSKTVKVGILSDTHGAIDERVLEVIAQCDIAVHAGDIGSAGVLDELAGLGLEVIAVAGNNDVSAKWDAQGHGVLMGLSAENSVALPGGELVVVHGHKLAQPDIRHDKLRREYPRARAVVYGHSHRLVCDETALPWVMNPGAAGRNRTFGGPSCLVLTASGANWTVRAHRFESMPAKQRA